MCSHRQTKTHQPKLPQWLESVDPWDEGRSVGCLAQSLCCKESLPDVQFRLGSVNVGQLKVTKCEDFLPHTWSPLLEIRGFTGVWSHCNHLHHHQLTTDKHFLTSFIGSLRSSSFTSVEKRKLRRNAYKMRIKITATYYKDPQCCASS